MCTYDITCRAVLQTYADYDPSAFRRHAARFSSPVYPGERIAVDLWKDGNIISFESKGEGSRCHRAEDWKNRVGLTEEI